MNQINTVKVIHQFNVLEDPRTVKKQVIIDRFRHVPSTVLRCMVDDLNTFDEIKNPVEIDGKLYNLNKCNQTRIFHHWAPHWNIEAVDVESGKKVMIEYTMGKFYFGFS